MAPVGFAVLGCGGIGRWHARQLQTLPGTRLVAMADPSEAVRKRAARDFAVPVVASADEILARQDVEAVTICTPPATHTGLAHAAAAAGKHVLVEKPLALTAAEAETLVAACASSNVHLGVVHQQRAQAACQAAKRLIEEGRLGTLVYAVGSLCWHRPDAVRASHAWRGSDRGGGLLLDAGVHLVDLLLWLLGPAGWVTAEGARGGSRLP